MPRKSPWTGWKRDLRTYLSQGGFPESLGAAQRTGSKLISSLAIRKGGEELIQVCSDLDEANTKERELRALNAAGRERPGVGLRLISLEPEAAVLQSRELSVT